MHAAWLDWVRASAFITAASAADPSSWDDVWHAAGKYASASGPSIALPAHLPHPQLWWGASNFASSPIRCHFSYFSHKLSALFSLSLSLSLRTKGLVCLFSPTGASRIVQSLQATAEAGSSPSLTTTSVAVSPFPFASFTHAFLPRAARSAALAQAPGVWRLLPYTPCRHYAKSRSKMPPKKAVQEEKIPLGRPGNSLKSGIVSFHPQRQFKHELLIAYRRSALQTLANPLCSRPSQSAPSATQLYDACPLVARRSSGVLTA